MGFERCGHPCPECDDGISYPALRAENESLGTENARLRVEHEKFRAWHKDAMDAISDSLGACAAMLDALPECPICKAPKGTEHGLSCNINRARYALTLWPPAQSESEGKDG